MTPALSVRIMTALAAAAFLTSCAGASSYSGTASSARSAAAADTDSSAGNGLQITESYPLQYAQQFRADKYSDGSIGLTIGEQKYLVVPEGNSIPGALDDDTVVLQHPLDNIYLVSSSAMDPILALDGLDSVSLTGTKENSWYLPAVKAAMAAGSIQYAGKYSMPDYEMILAKNCSLAIENTMIYHTPEVKEELEGFGIPVLVERSSYESDPLGRMEWIKLYGILLNKTEKAEQVFDAAVQRIQPLLDQEPTGKTAAFFSVTSNNLITVRKGGDYVAKMIEMAGGSYAFSELTDDGNNLATINLSLEDFYAGARDADVLIYNSTIEGMVESREALVEKCPMLADFKAVQNGDVWVTSQSLFQQSMSLADLILDMNRVFTEGTPADAELKFLSRLP